jgi:hypothetical protein
MGEGQSYPQAVICIPGEWKNRQELVTSIAAKSDGYLFAGCVLQAVDAQHSFELQLEGPDPRMLKAFRAVGPHWSDTDDMARIGGHSAVAYVIGYGGSRKNAEALMAAAAGVIKSGGLGAKIESAGLAHSPDVWLDLAKTTHLYSAYRAFVVCVRGEDFVYSCGMHNLGLRDAIVDASAADDPLDLVQSFTYYLFTESPIVQAGQTFSVQRGAPLYRIVADEGVSYEAGSLYKNPFGAWRLKPVLK